MPSEIGLLTSLERLIISGMKVGGAILDFIDGSTNLTVLDLHSNNFTGSIPDTFSKEHPALSYLDLELNQFTGVIPKSIGVFTSLTTLNLQHNQINGSIPSELAAIPTLRTYSLE
jgi:Leucine-rich repeat (LRR) protein